MGFRLHNSIPRESAVLRGCLRLLRLRGILHWRANTGAAKVGDRFIRFGPKGQSDILGCLPDGRLLAVEVKRPGERPRPEQMAFLENLRASGGVALWVCGVDRLAEALDLVLQGEPITLDGRRA